MAGRFPLYADADVHQPVVDALRAHGWDIVRAIDTYPEGTKDEVHFEHAAKTNRVLLTNDRRVEAIANQWLQNGPDLPGPDPLAAEALQADGLRRAGTTN